jgi:hypothetical protein
MRMKEALTMEKRQLQTGITIKRKVKQLKPGINEEDQENIHLRLKMTLQVINPREGGSQRKYTILTRVELSLE